MKRRRRLWCFGLSLMLSSSLAACQRGGSSSGEEGSTPATAAVDQGEMRALWVTRWVSRNDAEIAEAIRVMKEESLNTLLVQSNGNGMALHPSAVSPLSHLVTPGFDQLDSAIEQGHAEGIEVHAWLNVVKIWSFGLGTPKDSGHIIRAHPEWSMVDASGRTAIDDAQAAGSTVFYCPRQPGFVEYLRDVVTELAIRYPDLDGVHLDYIRYPGSSKYCFCDLHRADFRARHGREPTSSDPEFDAMRYEDITALVATLYDTLEAVAPRMLLSAAVFRNTDSVFQKPSDWLKAGKLDAVMPMIYISDTARLEEHTRGLRENSGGRLVIPGIACSRGKTGEQIAASFAAGAHGFALFSSSSYDSAARSQSRSVLDARGEAPRVRRPWKDGSRDTEPPILHNVAAPVVSADSARLSGETSEESTLRLELQAAGGPFSSYVGQTVDGYGHVVLAGGLRSDTAYSYQLVATDAAGNEARISGSFRTAAASLGVVTIDDSGTGFTKTGSWSSGSSSGGHDGGYLYTAGRSTETASATWSPVLVGQRSYEVAVHYVRGSNRSTRALFTITTAQGLVDVSIDQTQSGDWVSLGVYDLDGLGASVRLSNGGGAGGVVIADAMRFTPR